MFNRGRKPAEGRKKHDLSQVKRKHFYLYKVEHIYNFE